MLGIKESKQAENQLLTHNPNPHSFGPGFPLAGKPWIILLEHIERAADLTAC